MLDLLRRNSQLGLITLLGLTTAFTVACFAVFRAWRGETAAALIDLGIVIAISGPVVYAIRTGRTEGPGSLLCVMNSLCSAVACWLLGEPSVPWMYLVLMTNFFIATPKLALPSNVALTVAVLLVPRLFDGALQMASVAASAALVTFFAYLLAMRISFDRGVLEQIASLDALTGLPNRRMMEQALTTAVARQRAGQGAYGLVILDIDHFKEVNDTYGHPAGDAAIADLAAILKHEMRKQDQIFRFGGEEFVALIHVDSHEDLITTTERLRLAVRGALRGPGGRITVSLGAALLRKEDRWQEWFSLADAALYRAKSMGRDTSIISDM